MSEDGLQSLDTEPIRPAVYPGGTVGVFVVAGIRCSHYDLVDAKFRPVGTVTIDGVGNIVVELDKFRIGVHSHERNGTAKSCE